MKLHVNLSGTPNPMRTCETTRVDPSRSKESARVKHLIVLSDPRSGITGTEHSSINSGGDGSPHGRRVHVANGLPLSIPLQAGTSVVVLPSTCNDVSVSARPESTYCSGEERFEFSLTVINIIRFPIIELEVLTRQNQAFERCFIWRE